MSLKLLLTSKLNFYNNFFAAFIRQTLWRTPTKFAKAKSLSTEAKKNALETSETTSVGGKTFKRANGVWTDSAYHGQSTKNISRGTNEYKKLDYGLRSIVENIGGTVIVVWKEKAYRVQ